MLISTQSELVARLGSMFLASLLSCSNRLSSFARPTSGFAWFARPVCSIIPSDVAYNQEFAQSLPEDRYLRNDSFVQRSLSTDPVEFLFATVHRFAGIYLTPSALRHGLKNLTLVMLEKYHPSRGYSWGGKFEEHQRSLYFGTAKPGCWSIMPAVVRQKRRAPLEKVMQRQTARSAWKLKGNSL